MIARKTPATPPAASSDTLGAKSRERANASASRTHLEVEARPSLQRSQTPDPARTQDIKDIFTTGMFADPPRAKTWKFGSELLTDGHKRLVLLLREEAARLYHYNNRLRDRLAVSQQDTQKAQGQCEGLRAQLKTAADVNAQLTSDLVAAQSALTEMDAMVDTVRTKRLSRLVHVTPAQAEELAELGAEYAS